MRKMLAIAKREYAAAVKTKAFIIGLVIMPVLMLGSMLVQKLVEGIRDTKTRTFVVIDRTGTIYPKLEAIVDNYNNNMTFDSKLNKQVKPKFTLRQDQPSEDIGKQRYELSEEVRKGKIYGFLDIGKDVLNDPPYMFDPRVGPKKDSKGKDVEGPVVYYYSNRPTFMDFSSLASEALTAIALEKRAADRKTTVDALKTGGARLIPVAKGLYKYYPESDDPYRVSDTSRFAGIFVPFALIMLMFMIIMSGATPLMQGIVEEKMQRIAEVLLGCVSPFQLMMGKLLGMTAVSLTIGAVYLAGAYWAAHHFEWTEYVTPELLIWFLIYQTLAVLMFGSLFIAIGAGCSDMKETQNLLGPVMIIICLPLFLTMNVIQEPNGPVATGMSFFPFATPMLMIARLSVPPGVDFWQPIAGGVLVLLTTIFCVWVASRIFRVGILMQGKGAKLGEMMRWVFKG